MRRLPVLVMLTLLTAACDRSVAPSLPGEAPVASDPAPCPALVAPASAQVLLPPGSTPLHKNAYQLTDPETLRELVAFIALRRNVSPPSLETAPYPQVKVTFTGGNSVAVFGYGSDVFYFQCGAVKGTRYASAPELAEFQRLIARPKDPQ